MLILLSALLSTRGSMFRSRAVRDLIGRMSRENPLWGAPHIPGELLKLGIEISETSVAKYMLNKELGAIGCRGRLATPR